MKEYIIVKDIDTDEPIGRREIKSKTHAENIGAYIINKTLIIGYAEFDYIQELAKDLPDLEEYEKI